MSQCLVRAFHFPPAASHVALLLYDGEALGSVEWRAQPTNTATMNRVAAMAFTMASFSPGISTDVTEANDVPMASPGPGAAPVEVR